MAAGGFQCVGNGGTAANNIATWNGQTWAPMGTGIPGTVLALVAYNNPGPICTLVGTVWRAQYYIDSVTAVPVAAPERASGDVPADGDTGTVLVADVLELLESLAFRQNLTSYPSANCTTNWILWDGVYQHAAEAGKLTLERRRCTQTVYGCISCTPTTVETGTVRFGDDCNILEYTSSSEAATIVYFAETPRAVS